MLATKVRTTPPDVRVPRFTICPQAAATLAMAGDHASARIALVLAVGVDLPLHVAGRVGRWYPDLPSLLPLAAGTWALLCVAVFPQVLGPGLHDAAMAAAWSSLAIAVLLYLLPGPWSRVGAPYRNGVPRPIPRRRAARHVARRLVGVALLASVVALLPAPWLATAFALVALGALTITVFLDSPCTE